jgi:hypothetical protein
LDDPLTAGRSQPSGTVLPPPEICDILHRRLRRETQGTALFDLASRGRYATDASIYQILPVGAFIPTDEQDIAIAVDIARDLKIPVIARGGGSSQCGQTIGAALIIDNSKYFRRVIDIDVERRVAVVQPGVVLDDLNAQLKAHGLWFPVDVSTVHKPPSAGWRATIPAARAQLHTATWSTTCSASKRGCRAASCSNLGRSHPLPAAPHRSRSSSANSRRGIATR